MDLLAMDNTRDMGAILKDADVRDAVTVGLYDNFEELAPIQQEWDELLESVGGGIFLTYDWCRIWWKYYGKKRNLNIFIFRHQEKLVGIVPVFIEKICLGPVLIRAVKILCTDFTLSTVILPIQEEFSRAVAKGFLDNLISDYQWDVLHLGPISGNFNSFMKLLNLCRENIGCEYKVVSKNPHVQTYFPLQETWEKQLASLKSNERGNIKRNYNNLPRMSQSKSESLVSCFATTDNFEEFFEEFVQLHQSRWGKVGKLGHFGDWPKSKE